MQVVEDDEKERLLASGAWFDHPNKAKNYKEELLKMDLSEPKVKKRKAKMEVTPYEEK